jgi:hypothetical protein
MQSEDSLEKTNPKKVALRELEGIHGTTSLKLDLFYDETKVWINR